MNLLNSYPSAGLLNTQPNYIHNIYPNRYSPGLLNRTVPTLAIPTPLEQDYGQSPGDTPSTGGDPNQGAGVETPARGMDEVSLASAIAQQNSLANKTIANLAKAIPAVGTLFGINRNRRSHELSAAAQSLYSGLDNSLAGYAGGPAVGNGGGFGGTGIGGSGGAGPTGMGGNSGGDPSLGGDGSFGL